MTTTSDKLKLDGGFYAWAQEVRSKFDQSEEFDLASEIYSFAAAHESGMSPQEAYDDFDAWVTA